MLMTRTEFPLRLEDKEEGIYGTGQIFIPPLLTIITKLPVHLPSQCQRNIVFVPPASPRDCWRKQASLGHQTACSYPPHLAEELFCYLCHLEHYFAGGCTSSSMGFCTERSPRRVKKAYFLSATFFTKLAKSCILMF